MKKIPNSKMGYVFALLVALLLLGLPIAVWLDLSKLVETNLRRQAGDVNSIISSVRNYYADNVVGRILASPGMTKVVHNYKDIPGAIPIPATLSLELGKVISEQQRNIEYRCRITLLKIAHRMRLMNSRPPRSAGCDKIQISS
ncbi:MAG: hypothetical protein WAK55_19645 [Xanthobacteraceae bacterium]